MTRLTARLLLFFAFAGNLFPAAMAAIAPAPHACCRRNAHHCHDSAGSAEPAFHDSSCCNRNCCRAIVNHSPIAHSVQIVTSTLLAEESIRQFASAARLMPAFHSSASRAPPLL
jgi:hypothetical protein